MLSHEVPLPLRAGATLAETTGVGVAVRADSPRKVGGYSAVLGAEELDHVV